MKQKLTITLDLQTEVSRPFQEYSGASRSQKGARTGGAQSAHTTPWGDPKSMKISIIFRHRFWIDFWSFLLPKLDPFSDRNHKNMGATLTAPFCFCWNLYIMFNLMFVVILYLHILFCGSLRCLDRSLNSDPGLARNPEPQVFLGILRYF